MNEDNLIPALSNASEEMPNELSAVEFQRKLYDWFEERGMLSDLRAHLRKQMIGVLKDTAIGRTVSCHQKPTVSPKLQAINLLIAEFLLLQDYHYSLSVFSTEVPLINVFPQFSSGTLNHPGTTKQWKFNEKDALDILETLSIEKNTKEGKNILFAYFKNAKDALLTCIIRTFNYSQNRAKINSEKTESEKKVNDLIDHLDQLWINNVTDILTSYNVNSLCMEEIVQLLNQIVENEKKRLKEEAREAYLRLQEKLQHKVTEREEEQNKKISEIKKLLEIETGEKQKRQTEINTFEAHMQKHNKLLQDRYHQVIAREKALEERQKKLDAQEAYLRSQQNRLDASYAKLFQEQKLVIDLQEKLQLAMQQKATEADAKFYETIKTECKNIKTQLGETHDALTCRQMHNNGTEVLKSSMEKVQLENENLKTVNKEQRQRIESLSQQASNLMRNLDISQTAIGFLNNGFALTDPISRTSSSSSRNRPVLRNGTTYTGAGEEVYHPTSAREYKNLLERHHLKRRIPPRPLTVHSSSTSDEITNNILEEARERLKRLEEESEEVDKRYKHFKKMQERHSDNSPRLKANSQFREATYSFTEACDVLNKSLAHQSGTFRNFHYRSEERLSDRVGSTSQVNQDEGEFLSHQDEDSVASSNILELLAARASSASISDFEMTDGGKSDDKTNKTKSEKE